VLASIGTLGFLFTLLASVIEIEGDLAGIVVFFSACMLIAVGLLVRRRGGFPKSGGIFLHRFFHFYIAVLFA